MECYYACRDLFGHCSLLPHLEFRPGKPSGSRGKLGQLNSTHLVVSLTLPFSSSLPSLFLSFFSPATKV